jgi:hypothetical protein
MAGAHAALTRVAVSQREKRELLLNTSEKAKNGWSRDSQKPIPMR